METKKIGFVLFENYLQRKDIGSSRIRGHWLLEKMPEAELFIQGKEYETIIFQKVYWKEMARAFKGKKILDICDPDWLDGHEVVSFLKEMDAVTVPTEKLKEAISKFTDRPIYVIPDRIQTEKMPSRKIHTNGQAKKIVWFGYSHNMDILDQCLFKIKKLGLTLKVISDGNYNSGECSVENIRWNAETWQDDIKDADFALLPEKLFGRGIFKSLNKTHQAWMLGLPVAKTQEDMDRLMDPVERQKDADEHYEWAKENCKIEKSVEEMRAVIDSIKK